MALAQRRLMAACSAGEGSERGGARALLGKRAVRRERRRGARRAGAKTWVVRREWRKLERMSQRGW